MANAIQVKCPNCGANLRAGETAAAITCEYCGLESAIQRRTRIFERVMPPMSDARQLARVAIQRHSRGWIAGLVGSILLFTLIPISIAYKSWDHARKVRAWSQPKTRSGNSTFTPAVKPEDRPPSWQGTDGVLIADVDGDGTPELIGRGRQVNAGDIVMLLALDLATGKTKWKSEALGTYTETYQGPLALAGNMLVFASERGEVQTFALQDGKRIWRTKLDERARAFCAGTDDSNILVLTADDKLRTLARADGKVGEPQTAKPKRITSHGRETPCTELPTDDETPYEQSKPFYDTKNFRKKLGIDVDTLLAGPSGRVIGASRSTGTRVTMLVMLNDDDSERWRATATEDPLASEGAPRTVAVGEKEVCAVYYSDTYRIACFAAADGKRLWNEKLESSFEGLHIVGRSLVVTSHTDLEVLDLDTGKLRWKLD